MRSLADDIRGRSDDDVRRLLVSRPDLARPAPADLTSLAARASTRASVQRAVDHLDLAHLHTLEAAVLSPGPVDSDEVTRLLGAPDPRRLEAVLDDLWTMALLWRGPDGLHLVRTVLDVVGADVAGLGPPLGELAPGRRRPPEVDLADAPEAVRSVAHRLARGPAVGTRPEDARGATGQAVGWLVDRGLLVAVDERRVVMPREVALALRDGRLHPDTSLDEADPEGPRRLPDEVDHTAGGQVSDLLVLVDELAACWGPEAPRVLRAGGLSVRDLGSLASTLDIDARRAAFVVEVAWAAGLVEDDGGLEPVWAPTPAYDDWQQRPGASQWVPLARGWLTSTRAPHLAGPRPDGNGHRNALGPDLQWPPIRALRLDVLHLLAEAPEGMARTEASIVAGLRFRRPRRLPHDVETVVRAVLAEAEWIGVTGRGALSSAGRRLLDDAPDEVLSEEMHPHLPTPVERVLLQADLTAIAPGPMVGTLAQFMRLVADVESRGGATVYRFGEHTVRRCLDAGWSADQILSALADASDTPVPQPLEYLVRDVARRHGRTRVGAATCYVRSDDEAGLEALLAQRSLAPLQLRRVAPTVLVAQAPVSTVLDLLREHRVAPVVESASGGIVIPEGAQRRASGRRRTASPTVRPVDDEMTETLVAALRAGEETAAYERQRRSTRRGPDLPSTDPTTALAVLREAAADRQGVWLGYADAGGQVRRLLFYPDRVEGGRVHGSAEGRAQTLSIHRVTGVATG